MRREKVVGLEQDEVIEEGIQEAEENRRSEVSPGAREDRSQAAPASEDARQKEGGGGGCIEQELKGIQITQRYLEGRGHRGPEEDGCQSQQIGAGLIEHGAKD